MKRRDFINTAGILGVTITAVPLVACKEAVKSAETELSKEIITSFSLPDLPYAYNALAPNIDEQTMTIHHDKHHAGYVKKLNAALEKNPMAGKSLEDMLSMLKDEDSDLGVRNNGGGHYNHSMFWKIMKPGSPTTPKADLSDAINKSFGSFEEMQNQFSKAAATVFGSGWAWLVADENKNLFISATPNQDNPLMKNIVEKPGTPIMGIDVWEHAYYLNYQNRRKDYIASFMEIINWDQVAENFKSVG